MTKYEAFVNAQGVYAWAVLFGHGSLHILTNWCSEIEMVVHFKWSETIISREEDIFRSLVLDDTTLKWTPRPDLKIFVLQIIWHYTE